MSDPIRQHYVPQVYLKNFSCEGSKNQYVYVLSKEDNRIFTNSIQKVASKKNYYTVPREDDKYVWENYYARTIEPILGDLIEELCVRISPAIIQDGSIVFPSSKKVLLSQCIIAQVFRGNYAREHIKSFYDLELNDFSKKTHDHTEEVDRGTEWLLENLHDDAIWKDILMRTTLFKKSNSINLLSCMKYIFLKITGAKYFVTSNNPVLMMNSSTLDVTPFSNGLAKISTVLFYPLSSKIMLCALHKAFNGMTIKHEDCSLKILSALDETDIKIINTLNQKQFEQCDGYVYSQDDNELYNILLYNQV